MDRMECDVSLAWRRVRTSSRGVTKVAEIEREMAPESSDASRV